MKEKPYFRFNNSCIKFGNFLKLPFCVIDKFGFSKDSLVCKFSRLPFSSFASPPAE